MSTMDGEDYGIQMSNTEVAEFLTEQGHGVLSFGGETPYGLPLSFGYDLMNNRCIFQLVSKPNSQKQRHLSDVKTVRSWVEDCW